MNIKYSNETLTDFIKNQKENDFMKEILEGNSIDSFILIPISADLIVSEPSIKSLLREVPSIDKQLKKFCKEEYNENYIADNKDYCIVIGNFIYFVTKKFNRNKTDYDKIQNSLKLVKEAFDNLNNNYDCELKNLYVPFFGNDDKLQMEHIEKKFKKVFNSYNFDLTIFKEDQ